MNNFTSEIIVAIISGVFGIVTALITSNISLRRKTAEAITNNLEIQKISREILDKTSASRFLLIKASIGKKKHESTLTLTAIYEDFRRPLESLIDGFKDVLVDKEYHNTLLELCSNPLEFLDIKTDNLNDGFMKRYYKAEGIKHTKLFLIKESNDEIIFGSIPSTVSDSYEATEYIFITLALLRVKSIIKKLNKWSF